MFRISIVTFFVQFCKCFCSRLDESHGCHVVNHGNYVIVNKPSITYIFKTEYTWLFLYFSVSVKSAPCLYLWYQEMMYQVADKHRTPTS